MADATAHFAIELDDGVTIAAQSAEEACERLEQAIFEDTRALRKMEAAMRSLKGSTSASATEVKRLSDAITAQKAKIAGAQASYLRLGGTYERSNKRMQGSTAGTVGWLDRLLGATEGVGGAAGESAGRVKQLREGLGQLGGKGGAVVAVIVVLGVLLGALGAKLTAVAVKAADAARSYLLLAKAATGSAFAGRELSASVERVSRLVPTAKAELQEMALELARVGLKGRALEDALGAAAVAGSTLGGEAGSAIRELAKKWQAAGRTMASAADFEGAGVSLNEVASALAGNLGISFDEARARILEGQASVEEGLEALNRAVRAKLGGVAQEQLLSLSAQAQRAKDNVGEIFAGVEVGPFLSALQGLLGMLDESTSAGRLLRAVASTILQPLVDGATAALPTIQAFAEGFLEAFASFTVGIKEVSAWFDKFKTPEMEPILSAAQWGKVVFGALATVVGIVYAAFKLLGFAFDVVVGSFTILIKGVVALAQGFYWLGGKAVEMQLAINGAIDGAILSLSNLVNEALTAGGDFVMGIIQGITGKAGELVSAVTGLAGKAVAAFRAKIESRSPSRVMAELGGYMSLGVAQGIKEKSPRVEQASREMISIPGELPTKDGASAAPRRGGNTTVNVTVHVAPGAEAKIVEPSFLERLAAAVEDAVAQGRGVEVTV